MLFSVANCKEIHARIPEKPNKISANTSGIHLMSGAPGTLLRREMLCVCVVLSVALHRMRYLFCEWFAGVNGCDDDTARVVESDRKFCMRLTEQYIMCQAVLIFTYARKHNTSSTMPVHTDVQRQTTTPRLLSEWERHHQRSWSGSLMNDDGPDGQKTERSSRGWAQMPGIICVCVWPGHTTTEHSVCVRNCDDHVNNSFLVARTWKLRTC